MMKDYLAQQLHSVILRSVVLVSAESDDQKGESITFFSHHQITRKNSIVVLVGLCFETPPLAHLNNIPVPILSFVALLSISVCDLIITVNKRLD
jgi:hypothetical protein